MKAISLTRAVVAVLASSALGHGADLSAEQIVGKANEVSYFAGRDGRADVTMTIEAAKGAKRVRNPLPRCL